MTVPDPRRILSLLACLLVVMAGSEIAHRWHAWAWAGYAVMAGGVVGLVMCGWERKGKK